MEFLDNFGKKVQDVAFIAAEKAQQVAAVASEKASIVADKAKTEYEMAAERRSMDKNYREGDAPEAVADIVAAIKNSQDKLAAYEAAKAEAAAAKAEAAAAKKAKEPVIEVTIEKKTDAAEPVAEENDCAPCEEVPAQEEPAADEEPKEN